MAAGSTPDPVFIEEPVTDPEFEVPIELEVKHPSKEELYELKGYVHKKDLLGFQNYITCLRRKYPAYFTQESIRKKVVKLQLQLSEETLRALYRPRK